MNLKKYKVYYNQHTYANSEQDKNMQKQVQLLKKSVQK